GQPPLEPGRDGDGGVPRAQRARRRDGDPGDALGEGRRLRAPHRRPPRRQDRGRRGRRPYGSVMGRLTTRALVIGLAALLAASHGRAQGAQGTVLTLDDVVERARAQTVAVRQAALEVEAREAALAGARGQRLPSIGLYSSGARRYGLAFDQTVGELTQATSEFASAGAEVSWTVFDGFATGAAVAGAAADRAEAERLHERARQASVLEAL